MAPPPPKSELGRLALVPRSAATIVVATALLILVSWDLHLEPLQGFVPGFPKMNPLTAVDFLACGISLWLVLPEHASSSRRIFAQIFSGFAAATSFLLLLGIFRGWKTGIDQILFRHLVSVPGRPPAHMAPGTALDFLLISSSLLLLNVETRRGSRPAQFLAFIAGAIAAIDVTGYAYGGQPFIGYRLYRSMALPTALSFVLLAIGIFLSRPKTGFVAVCFGDGTGAILIRRLLPLAVLTPIVLGWLRILGQRAGWFNSEAGTAFTSAAYIIVLATIVLWTAQALQHIDNDRSAVQENLRQSEERYRLRSTELEASNRELEAFSYSVSHDLRSPLRAIDGFSKTLLEDYGDRFDATGSDYLNRIRAATQRMGTLIDDLLNLSRVTRAEIRREPIDLTQLANTIATDLRTSQPNRDVDFDIANGLHADGDPRLIRVALENLIGNAWKFTTKRQHAHIEFGAAQDNGKPNFFVRDNGAGFDPAYASRLFGAFQRLHLASDFPGTGIGLATVQRIILRHGGKIWGEGVPGQGATFYFTM